MTRKLVILGTISGVHGVKGWLKVYSYTRPVDNIVSYRHWRLKPDEGSDKATDNGNEIAVEVSDFRLHGKKILVQLASVNDRGAAQALVGYDIAVFESELPVLEDEINWRDLIGLTVKDTHGDVLGEVVEIMETGANDVLLLKNKAGKSHAMPWLAELVISVDLENSLIVADWEPLI